MTQRARSKRVRQAVRSAPLLVGLVLGAVQVLAQQASQPRAIEFRKGVWFDAARARGYLMVPDGGVEAVDLQTGKPSWREREMDKPLLASDGWLLAQRMESPQELSLVMMGVDGARPRELWEASFKLPEGVQATIDDAKYVLFNAQACVRGADELGLSWTAYRLQKPLLLTEGSPDNRTTTGNLLIGLKSGQLRESSEQACAPASAPVPAGRMPEPGSVTPSGATVRYPSADGQHYLATKELAPARSGEPPTYQWEVYAAGSGTQIAKLTQPEVGAWFIVRGDLLIHDVSPQARMMEDRSGDIEAFAPPRIRAIALASGAEKWSRVYRDTRFKGDIGSEEEEEGEEGEAGEEDEDEREKD